MPAVPVVVVVVTLAVCGFCEALDPARQLYADLFGDYSPTLRPRKDYADVVNVTVGFTLLKLIDILDQDQVMTVIGFMGVSWTDDYLKWDPKKYGGIKRLSVNRFEIWTPDLTVRDTTNGPYDVTKKEFDYVEIYSDGKAGFYPVGELELLCPLNIRYFPFDEHICAISLGNWMLTSSEQRLYPGNVEMRSLAAHIHWRILGANMHRYCYGYGEFQYDMLRVYFRLERKAKHYIINFVLPIVILTVLSITNYIVPLDHSQRVNISMVILLSYVVFQLTLFDIMPHTSDNFPYIATLIFVDMGLLCASITMDSILQWMAASDPVDGKPNPLPGGSYENATFKAFCIFCCLKKTHHTEVGDGGCCRCDVDITDFVGDGEDQGNSEVKTWRDIALKMDRFFFWIYLIALITFNVIFFLLVMIHPQAHLPAHGKCPGFTWNVVDKLDLSEPIEDTYEDVLPND